MKENSMKSVVPRYIMAKEKGWLKEKIQAASDVLRDCTLCPRLCRVDRTKDEKGYCGTGKWAKAASFAPHFGEEPPLVGNRGSGTIFFSHCSLQCVFCQNHEISIQGEGQAVETNQIAAIMLLLQEKGCHNINFVTPTHVVPQILKALDTAIDRGLRIPLVYNCAGYERSETLNFLTDIIDIFMPDFKFWNPDSADSYCNAPDYPETARKAIQKMHAMVGDLVVDSSGIAVSGLLVRHLVMPGHLEDTRQILAFLKEKVSSNTHINLMSQYRPMGNAATFSALSHPLTPEAFKTALQMGKDAGLRLI